MLTETSTFPAELKKASFHLILKIVTNCLKNDVITLIEFVRFSKVIFEQGYLSHGDEIWLDFINKTKENIFSWKLESQSDHFVKDCEGLHEICIEAVRDFLDGRSEKFVTIEETALIIFITLDIGIEKQETKNIAEQILNRVFDASAKFCRNPYVNPEEVKRSLGLTQFILQRCINSEMDIQKNHISMMIVEKLIGMVKHVFSIYRAVMQASLNEEYIDNELVHICYTLQSTLCAVISKNSNPNYDHFLIEHLAFIVKVCSYHMKDMSENKNITNIYLIFESLKMLCNIIDGKQNVLMGSNFKQLESQLHDVIKHTNLDISAIFPVRLTKNEKNQRTNDALCFDIGDITNALWSIVAFALKRDDVREDLASRSSDALDFPLTLSTCNIDALVHKILETIDISVGNDMIPLLQCLGILMPLVVMSSPSLSAVVLQSVWRVFKEQERRDSRFWKIFVPCVNVLFNMSILLSGNKELLDMVTMFWRYLEDAGEKKSGLFNVVVNHCCSVWEDCLKNVSEKDGAKEHCFRHSIEWCIDLIVDACTFGHVQKKPSRIMQQVIRYFEAKYGGRMQLSKNINIDYQVRWVVMKTLLRIGNKCKDVLTEVMKRLIEKDRKISEQVKRYYENSITHRQKLRIWQTMLTLVKFVKEENAEEIMAEALSVMIADNQPSIRYYIEWFVVVLIHKMPSLKSVIWQKLNEASERRVCSVTCLMSIIMHVTVLLPDEDFSEMAAEAFKKILPWIQIHHMQARVHAQIVIWRVWDELKRRKCSQVLNEFDVIESLFSLNESNASVFKAREEIRHHFYFHDFNPIKHLSLETIFCSMLKLLSVGDDEILDQKDFISVVDEKDCIYGMPVNCKGQSLFDLVMAKGERSASSGNDRNFAGRENIPKSGQQGMNCDIANISQ